MESRGRDKDDELAGETPEDVAVLYSWANLHGAKYRDFSASRREYRAQLRHRAAEQVREQALLAQAEAEGAAKSAESTARYAAEVARTNSAHMSDSGVQRSLREAEVAARMAAAERVEAARRAEAAAVAEAAARREEREIAEAHASAQRQAARYADSEIRRRKQISSEGVPQVQGHMSDPYTPNASQAEIPQTLPSQAPLPERAPLVQEERPVQRPVVGPNSCEDGLNRYSSGSQPVESYPAAAKPEYMSPAASQVSVRRPQGYSPDDASGVRQIYRGPEYGLPPQDDSGAKPALGRNRPVPIPASPMTTVDSQRSAVAPGNSSQSRHPVLGKRHTDPQPQPSQIELRQSRPDTAPVSPVGRAPMRPVSSGDRASEQSGSRTQGSFDSGFLAGRRSIVDPLQAPSLGARPASALVRAVSPFSQTPAPANPARGRRAQDGLGYQPAPVYSNPPRQVASEPLPDSTTSSSTQRAAYSTDPAGPAWLYDPPAAQQQAKPMASAPLPQSSVAETLQRSRERVAARWFALKGVFEQPGQEQPEVAPVRQKEIRTPILAVFSLAGGVGKTSLVATIGRSLSSLGEKILLTDTTSHGLLPFYFGASELRQGTVRTFSPPSGSTDAPIYLVSYDIDQWIGYEAAQELLVEEIINNSRGTHRILLDLMPSSGWIVRHLARMNPTILVPLAPDMNSVISLQAVEKFFHGCVDADGRPIQPFYVLNQFDASLPLHLDVREVLRRQLGDRLLPFVIRRAPTVSEALAEGMTVVDYAPESPVSEDYLNVATWLRTIAAPATAGFRNVRWSER
jgi:cellulose synthase operon protein YhjQ